MTSRRYCIKLGDEIWPNEYVEKFFQCDGIDGMMYIKESSIIWRLYRCCQACGRNRFSNDEWAADELKTHRWFTVCGADCYEMMPHEYSMEPPIIIKMKKL